MDRYHRFGTFFSGTLFSNGPGIFTVALIIFMALAFVSLPKANAEGEGLWMRVSGTGDQTVVFISGNGNDSSVWAGIEAQVRDMGARTVVYDRAGLGQSALTEGPYQIQDEADTLKQALAQNGVEGPLVLVAHSYGGLIAALVAEGDMDVGGVVFVDALLPADLSDKIVSGVLAEYTPRFKALEEAAPALARAIIPVVNAYPETAERMKNVSFAPSVAFIDILAEQTWVSQPEQIAHIQRVHADFVAASDGRSSVLATGSSHNVMRDKPEIIIRAISRMLARR